MNEKVEQDPVAAAEFKAAFEEIRRRRRVRQIRRNIETLSDAVVAVVSSYSAGDIPDPGDSAAVAKVQQQVLIRLRPLFTSVLLRLFVKFILPLLIKWLLSEWAENQDVLTLQTQADRFETLSESMTAFVSFGNDTERLTEIEEKLETVSERELASALMLPIAEAWDRLGVFDDVNPAHAV